MKQAIIPVNKGAGAGAEGFLAMKEAKGDPNKIVITLSNLFTTPLATGVPFNWQDITPVAMLALDQFVLWDNAEKPYKTAKEYIDAAKAAGPGKFKMGGTGSKSEDQIITVAIEKATGAKFTYLPFKGGGDVAVQLVGNHVDSTVNNPIEAVAQWRAGKLRALCVFDDTRMPYKEKITPTQSWNDIPTCKEAGVATDYVMLRGIFMAPGVTQEQVDFYENALKEFPEDQSVFIFSDDPVWCKEQELFASDRFSVCESGSSYVDLCLMSMCSDFIIANSTFSWWGAWLSRNKDKKVVYPSKWFGPNNGDKLTKDLFPEEWRMIDEN